MVKKCSAISTLLSTVEKKSSTAILISIVQKLFYNMALNVNNEVLTRSSDANLTTARDVVAVNQQFAGGSSLLPSNRDC